MIIGISDLETYLGETITGTTSEDKYTFLIDAVQEDAEKYCNKKFDRQDYTEYQDGNSANEIFLDQYPIQSVSKVEYGSWTATKTEITSDDYIINAKIGSIVLPFDTAEIDRVLYVEYNAGYSDDSDSSYPIPNDLKKILMDEIKNQFVRKYLGNIKSERLGDYSYTLADNSFSAKNDNNEFFSKLDKYKKLDF